MPALADVGLPVLVLWSFGLATLSAVMPWVNAEVIVLTFPAVTSSTAEIWVLILVATTGQMAGKCLVYWAGRRGAGVGRLSITSAVERWRTRISRNRAIAPGVVFVSSTVGLPPFYAISLVAGAMRMPFRLFLVAGSFGRLVRFSTLAFGARAVFDVW